MKVVVASANPVKVRAVRAAFERYFPDQDLDVTSASVPSGVSEQPETDDETRTGARNRAANAAAAEPDADYWVGLEGGVDRYDGELMAFAWMAVRGRNGLVSDARSLTLPLPQAVRALVDSGLELGDANDRVFATVNSKQAGGAYGLLTEGRETRESIYIQTVMMALMPFTNELYQHASGLAVSDE